MKATFDNTVSILVKAYLNDELEHGDCEACAVGNIVHAAGFKRYPDDELDMKPDSCGKWKHVFFTADNEQYISRDEYDKDFLLGIKMIYATGYKVKELASVEYAFETAPQGKNEDEWMFNGLMACVDVLAEIHGINLEQKESAKLLFVK